jgi:DNA-binding MarR family transcriptional regulator
MEKLDSVLFYYIEKAIKTYRQYAQKELRNAGLSITVDQWLTLNCLNENPQITQKELAEAIFKDTASITRIIDLLVTAKYIKRNINKEDKRKSNLTITNLGLEIIDKASPIVNNYRNAALKGIGIAKEEHVKMVMKTIIKNCQ